MSQNNNQRTFTTEEITAIFEDIREALLSLPTKANTNDRVKLCIGMCIENGIDTKNHIVGMVKKLGFNQLHVGTIIDKSTGPNPERHLWSLGEDRRFRNLDIPSTLPDMG